MSHRRLNPGYLRWVVPIWVLLAVVKGLELAVSPSSRTVLGWAALSCWSVLAVAGAIRWRWDTLVFDRSHDEDNA